MVWRNDLERRMAFTDLFQAIDVLMKNCRTLPINKDDRKLVIEQVDGIRRHVADIEMQKRS